MTDYKQELLQKYASTHTVHRKGEATLEAFRGKAPTWEKTLGRFLPDSKEKKVVDIGCGNGKLLWWIQSKGFHDAEGIDISEEQVRIAASLGVRNVRQSDIRAYLEDRVESLDLIILRDVIEHFEKRQVMEYLELARAALKPGGRVLVQVPNAESPFFGRIRYGDFTHEVAFTAASLQQVFRNAGFRSVRCNSADPVYHGIRGLPRRLLWKAVEAAYRLMLYAELGPGEKIVTQNIVAVAAKD